VGAFKKGNSITLFLSMVCLKVQPVQAVSPQNILFYTVLSRKEPDSNDSIPLDKVTEEIPDFLYGHLGEDLYLLCDNNHIKHTNFDPFGHTAYKTIFTGKGIADHVRLISGRKLLDRFGEEYTIEIMEPNSRAIRHLERLGLEEKKIYGLEDYVQRMEANIR
jgi:hypothetical protein